MSELITYLEAEKILAERMQAYPDEIAQWVFDGELPAYINRKFEEPKAFVFRPDKFIHNDDYLGTVSELWFKLVDIEAFQPSQRYIPRQALLDAGAKYLNDEAEALRGITTGIADRYLPEYHPIVGLAEIEGDLFRSGLFAVAHVMEYSKTKDWLKVQADKAPRAVGGSNKLETEKTNDSELHILFWRVYQALLSDNSKVQARKVWVELKSNYAEYDVDEIIQEVTATEIFWCSHHGNEQRFKRSSFASTLSRLKKSPPF